MASDYSLIFGTAKPIITENTPLNSVDENGKKKEEKRRNSYTDNSTTDLVEDFLDYVVTRPSRSKSNQDDSNSIGEPITSQPTFTTNQNKSCYAMSYESGDALQTGNDTAEFGKLFESSATAAIATNGLSTGATNHSATGFNFETNDDGGTNCCCDGCCNGGGGGGGGGNDDDDCDCDCDCF